MSSYFLLGGFSPNLLLTFHKIIMRRTMIVKKYHQTSFSLFWKSFAEEFPRLVWIFLWFALPNLYEIWSPNKPISFSVTIQTDHKPVFNFSSLSYMPNLAALMVLHDSTVLLQTLPKGISFSVIITSTTVRQNQITLKSKLSGILGHLPTLVLDQVQPRALYRRSYRYFNKMSLFNSIVPIENHCESCSILLRNYFSLLTRWFRKIK